VLIAADPWRLASVNQLKASHWREARRGLTDAHACFNPEPVIYTNSARLVL
jgi:hypothetical protein